MSTASATYLGRPVRVIARDSDPRVAVWVCFEDDPDTSAMVDPADLVAA